MTTGSSGPLSQQVGDVADAAAGAQRLVLGDVVDPQPERGPVTDAVPEDLRPVRRGEHHVVDAGGAGPRQQVVQERHAGVGSIGFGVFTVSGRSRVPWPPTSSTASVIDAPVSSVGSVTAASADEVDRAGGPRVGREVRRRRGLPGELLGPRDARAATAWPGAAGRRAGPRSAVAMLSASGSV